MLSIKGSELLAFRDPRARVAGARRQALVDRSVRPRLALLHQLRAPTRQRRHELGQLRARARHGMRELRSPCLVRACAVFSCLPPSFLELLFLTSFLFYFGADPAGPPPEPAGPPF